MIILVQIFKGMTTSNIHWGTTH